MTAPNPAKRNARILLVLLTAMLLGGLAMSLGGCVPKVEELKAGRDDLVAFIERAKVTRDTLPPDSDARAAVDALIEEGEKKLPLLDASIRSAEQGQIDPALTAELRKIPVVGPYADLILGLGVFGYALVQRRRRQQADKALGQLAKGVDEVLPEPSESQRLAMGNAMDEDTKALVEKAKKGA
jgi:hypothetical protein